jgi:hypothetical protein
MSLKAFHIVFIVTSVLMAFGVAAIELQEFKEGNRTIDLVVGIGSVLAGAALLVYGRYFLKKLKGVGYL